MERSLLVCLTLIAASPAVPAVPMEVPTYTDGSPSTLRQGLAVQHFTVPYGCIGTQFDFYCDVSSGKGLRDHEVALQVYSADRKHLATSSVKVSALADGCGWVSLRGLNLEPDTYYAQLFTNSEALGPHLYACLHSHSGYRGGYAATGWEGGSPLGQGLDFQARLTCEHAAPAPVKLGGDPRLLAEGRVPHYAIVLADDAPLVEQTAAVELQAGVKALCGATLPILLETDYQGGPMVAVGFDRRLPAAMKPEAFGALAEDQIILKPGRNVLLLAGGEPSGTLYAVYELLHRLGVRWYSPDFTLTPHLDRVPLPTETVTYAPPVTGRQIVSGIRTDPAWMARNRFTTIAHWSPVGRRYGRPGAEGPDMHTAWRMVDADLLRQHPDWTAEVQGKRTLPVNLNTWDLCYTNPDARQYFLNRTLDWAREHPEIQTVWIGQNDSGMACECANCKAFEAAHGGRASAVIVQLANDLAALLVANGMTDRRVKTLAYGWSADPPTGMTVSDKVTVMVCRRAQVAAWRRIARHVAVYLYGNSTNFWAPDPTLLSDAASVSDAWRDGASNLYLQISGFAGTLGSDMVDLRSWMTARLMWDPAADPQPLMEDFCRGYYGPAAGAVLKALRLRQERFRPGALAASGVSPGLGAPDYVDPRALREINTTLERARAFLPPGEMRKHLEMASLSTLWTDFWLGAEGLGRYDAGTSTLAIPLADAETRRRYGVLARDIMVANGVNALSDNVRIAPRELAVDLMGQPWPAHRFQDASTEAVVVPGVGGMVADLRDTGLGFAPLKAIWGEMVMRYPLFSCTGDSVNGAQIRAYREVESGPDRVVMAAQQGPCQVSKTVGLKNRRLEVEITARSNEGARPELVTEIMFDLLDEALGMHPTVFVEQEGGAWTRREMGVETTFWWVEGPLDLGHPTGRIVLASQTRPAGVCLTFDPRQLGGLDFWYDRIVGYYQKREQHGMMRFFLHPRAAAPQPEGVAAAAGGEVRLGYSLQILPQARSVAGG